MTGMFPGFLIAIMDVLETMIYVSTVGYQFSTTMLNITGYSSAYFPLFLLLFYVSTCGEDSCSGIQTEFWR